MVPGMADLPAAPSADLVLRAAVPADGPAFVELVRALADFEKLAGPDDAAAARLVEHAFGATPRYPLLVGERGGELVAYAVYFFTYSTFRALPTLYLEDLFVHPRVRRGGIATAMMAELRRLAVANGCGRFEWTVLDWNEGAQRLYDGLGAKRLREWQLCRVDL
jgi:GNAT superfamily N-acetyltransferase